MALAPQRRCNRPGCRTIIRGASYCPEHAKAQRQVHDEQRPNSHQRGYNHRWRKAARTYLDRHPLCVECEKQGRITSATCVDHIIPHRGDQALFWDTTNNWQSLCGRCHAVKTARGE